LGHFHLAQSVSQEEEKVRKHVIWLFRTKVDRAEQISKRMTKEAPLTKAQKDLIRARNMTERDKYDMNNLGSYTRAFPSSDPVSYNFTNQRVGETKKVWRDAESLFAALERTERNEACQRSAYASSYAVKPI
jgi:hypothetical protein